jgi:hypothetical protein
MIKVFNILNPTFCLLLMIHLLAMSVCDDYLSKIINKSTIEQSFDIEEDTDNDSKNKTFEFDDFDDKYLVSSPSSFNYSLAFSLQENLSSSAFQYLQIVLPKSINEILIPPPRM